jgi:NitT/TauT family transport system substrate-binding protein
MKLKSILTRSLPAAFALLAASILHAENTPALTPIKFGHILVPGQGKIFVAQELGYFAEQGLQVELVEFQNSADGLAAVRAGKLDFGAFGATAPLFHIAKGADIRIVGGIHNEDAALITTAEKAATIKSVADLKGRKVAVVRLSSADTALRGHLLELGIVPGKDMQIFELKSPPAVIEAVRSGEVDAGTVWEPHVVRAVESGLKVVATSHDLLPDHPCCRLVVQTKDVTERPKLIDGVIAALLKAEKFGHDHRDQAVDIITKYIKLDRHIIDASYLNDQPTDPDVANTVRFWNVMRRIGYAEQERDIASYVDTSFYKRAINSASAADPKNPFWKQLETDYVRRDTAATAKN